jgi:uncharacterized protein YbjQ (UPF0145 family)
MLYATTSTLQGHEIEAYLGIVFGDAVLGVNVFKDLLASLRDVVGGRSGTYERELGAARDSAMMALTEQARALGADAVLGIDIDYEVLGSNNGMLMVSASGTAVRLRGGGPASTGWSSAGTAPGAEAGPQASPWSRPGG